MSNPTIVFVAGAWHSPKHYQPARDALASAGYPTECPSLPTFDAKPGTATFYDDVECIRSLLNELIEAQAKNVICVLHSYGGVVGTEAIHESLGKKARHNNGLNGGVLGILYMAAFILPLGACLNTTFGGSFPPHIQLEDDGSCTMKEPRRRFFNDLSKQDQDHWLSELRPHLAVVQQTPITYTAYKYHPVVYLYCEKDEALLLEVQKMLVGSSGVDFKIETCTAGHSPFLSQIDSFVGVIKRMAE